MNYTQLKPANYRVPGKSGFCLLYVRNVFGVGPKYPWAWTAWLATKYKHQTRTMPNVAVPCWFSYRGIQGHVVAYVPGKGFYSVTKYGVECFKSLAAVESFIGCKFVGWTEDINSVRVVAPVTAVYYVVKKGDTLTGIAIAYKITLAKLLALNPNIKNPNLISIGLKVRVK